MGELCIHGCSLSCIPFFCNTVASQAPLSVGLSWHEYYRGLPFPLPRDLPNPEIEPMSLMIPALAGRFFTTSATWEAWGKLYGM